MSGFIAIAVLLTLAVLVALLYPLLRGKGETPVAWRAAGITALLVIAGGAALYPVWSSFKWDQPELAPDSPVAMVGRLARRLEKQPDDVPGWLMLGKSYLVLSNAATPANQARFAALSARAFQRADTLAKGKNTEALMGLAEALINAGRGDLAGRPGRLFERALEVEPNLTKALYYSALAAAERHEFPLARSRLQKLLDSSPPANVQQVLKDQIQQLNEMEAMAAAGSAKAVAVANPPVAAADQAGVSLRITLAPAVAGKVSAGAPLFLSARIPGQRGAPLAARRLIAKFPQDAELLSTDAMVGGSGFAAGQELEIQAHVSNGGSAISRSGDPFGTVRVKAGAKGRTTIELNQLKP